MVIIVLPTFNEAEALPPLLCRLRDISIGHFRSSILVIVVDDGSTDGTSDHLLETGDLNIRLVTHEHNRGLSEALKTGLLAALEQADDNDIVISMDADDTHTPGLISRMTMLIEEGNDVVIASRFRPGARVLGVPVYRQFLSIGVSWLFRLIYPIRGVRDYSCGYRAYRASLLKEAFARWDRDFISEPGFSCMVDILLKLDKLGAICTEVPMILRYDRKPGKSKMNVKKTIQQTLSLLIRRRFGRE